MLFVFQQSNFQKEHENIYMKLFAYINIKKLVINSRCFITEQYLLSKNTLKKLLINTLIDSIFQKCDRKEWLCID